MSNTKEAHYKNHSFKMIVGNRLNKQTLKNEECNTARIGSPYRPKGR